MSRDRPTMSEMISSSVTGFSPCMSRVLMVCPSRMTVTESETAAISLSLWEIMIMVMPCSSRSLRMRARRLAESSSLSAAVGSSRMSSLTSFDKALAISTSCWRPTPMSTMRVAGSESSPTIRRSFAASALVVFQSMTPREERSLPRKMFSAIER